VLFGSRATGQARLSSDWDIGILGPTALRDVKVQAIRKALEDLPTLHSFDVVDLATLPARFREAVLRDAIRLA